MANEAKVLTIGIVGGGQGGLEMLKIFAQSNKTKVLFLVDRDPQAVAVEAARELKVPTPVDLVKAIQQYPADFIIEATGSPKVLEIIATEPGAGDGDSQQPGGPDVFYGGGGESPPSQRFGVRQDQPYRRGNRQQHQRHQTGFVRHYPGGFQPGDVVHQRGHRSGAGRRPRTQFRGGGRRGEGTAGQAKNLVNSIESINNNNIVMSGELEELLAQLA
jgi:NADH dehydrogenase FAD-containing subunit